MDLVGWLMHWIGKIIRAEITGTGTIYFPNNDGDIYFSGSIASIETSADAADVAFPNDNYMIYYSGDTGTIYGAN